jgi:hypothetical protein
MHQTAIKVRSFAQALDPPLGRLPEPSPLEGGFGNTSAGTARGRPCSSTATKVRSACVVVARSLVHGFSVRTSTSTSIEVWAAKLTSARTMTNSSTRAGRRKCSRSMETVTTGPPA